MKFLKKFIEPFSKSRNLNSEIFPCMSRHDLATPKETFNKIVNFTHKIHSTFQEKIRILLGKMKAPASKRGSPPAPQPWEQFAETHQMLRDAAPGNHESDRRDNQH